MTRDLLVRLVVAASCVLLTHGPLCAQLTVGTDQTLATAYEWRGMRLDSGPAWQQAVYAAYRKGGLVVTGGTWSVIDLSTDRSVPGLPAGLPQRRFYEVRPWFELSVGDPWFSTALGVTQYRLDDTAYDDVLRRPRRTTEVYWGVRGPLPLLFPGAPLVVDLRFFRDVDEVKGWYGELALAKRLPLWVGKVIPFGSVLVEARTGYAWGQAAQAGDTTPSAYLFANRGRTHGDLAARLTLLPMSIPLLPLSVSMNAEGHLTRAWDRRTRLIGFFEGGAETRDRLWWSGGIRITYPRCRPDRELCKDL